MGLKPKSHPVSVLTVEDSAELTITFDLSTAVKVTSHLYRWLLGEQEKMDEYTFTKKTPEEIQFDIRFIHSGMPANNFRQLTFLVICINPLYAFGVVQVFFAKIQMYEYMLVWMSMKLFSYLLS